MTDWTSTLDSSLYYHRRGWSLIPANPKTQKPCLEVWESYQTTRATEQQVREWFGGGRHRAIATVLGAVSGNLAAIDFDLPERYEWFRRTHPDLARILPTEATARPGYHVLFQCEPVGTQKRHKEGVELLCVGAYVVVTPSPGKRWLNPPNGEIPKIDPFTLGLEVFGITKRDAKTNGAQFTEEPEDMEETEEPEETKEIACASSLSSVKPKFTSEELAAGIDEAITRTLPTDTGQRDHCIFTFCQWLKAIPELQNKTAAQLKPIAQKWHAKAYPIIGTKAFEVTWQDFVYAWKRVKYPKGVLLEPAVQRAREDTHNPPEAADYEDPRTQLLLRVCWQLQQVHGDEPFYLSVRKAGEVIGLTAPAASKRMEVFTEDGVLAIATAHTNIWATRYKYIGKGSDD
jgi:hypothetical protein